MFKTQTSLFILIFTLVIPLWSQDPDSSSEQKKFSLNSMFIQLLEESEPHEAYRYIEMIIDQGDYDINDILFYLTNFNSRSDQLEKESLLLRLLDWFFDSGNQMELVEKTLFNNKAIIYLIDRLPHLKNSSLWIVIIKLGYYVQSKENFHLIDSFITRKTKLFQNGQLSDQDYYPLALVFLRLAEKTGEELFYYNVESIYKNHDSRVLVPLAKKVMKNLLKVNKK